jgi:hypothetical protein
MPRIDKNTRIDSDEFLNLIMSTRFRSSLQTLASKPWFENSYSSRKTRKIWPQTPGTLGDLCSASAEDLLRYVRGFGPKAIAELQAVLRRHRLKLRAPSRCKHCGQITKSGRRRSQIL